MFLIQVLKKNYTFYLNTDNITKLNQLIIYPCSRGNLMDEIINYLLKSPWIITELMNNKLEQINAIIEGTNNE